MFGLHLLLVHSWPRCVGVHCDGFLPRFAIIVMRVCCHAVCGASAFLDVSRMLPSEDANKEYTLIDNGHNTCHLVFLESFKLAKHAFLFVDCFYGRSMMFKTCCPLDSTSNSESETS